MIESKILEVPCTKCDAPPGSGCRALDGVSRGSFHAVRIRRALEDSEFWAWIDERLADPANVGLTEQEFLNRINKPGWNNIKARKHGLVRNVVPMPVRDFKKAAAGDSDEAA
jgi:hypothetical protein